MCVRHYKNLSWNAVIISQKCQQHHLPSSPFIAASRNLTVPVWRGAGTAQGVFPAILELNNTPKRSNFKWDYR